MSDINTGTTDATGTGDTSSKGRFSQAAQAARSAAADAASSARGEAASLKSQAGDKLRSFAVDGKERASGALGELSSMLEDAASQIDERLGSQFGGYARQAAGAVSGFADTLRDKDVDDLLDDARGFVRRSPAVAIGAAAAVGFVLARVVKSGFDEARTLGTDPSSTADVSFKADTTTFPDADRGGQTL